MCNSLIQEFPLCHFLKTNIRIFRTSFSENVSKKLLLFFTEDGPVSGRKIITLLLQREKVDTVLSMASPQ